MALPIRDGNQSLTTLSTILVSNSHIPAHTVVSFGAQGITDIATAVSGVELGPNTLNALENITVTLGQVTITGGLTDAQLRASAVTIGGVVTATISGTASVTFGTAVVTGSASILNFPATQTVTFSEAPVTFGLISGTVTANIFGFDSMNGGQKPLKLDDEGALFLSSSQAIALATGTNRIGVVTIGAGTVTIGAGTAQIGSVTASISNTVTIAGTVTLGVGTAQIGSVTASNLATVLATYETNAQENSFNTVAQISGQGYVSDSAKSHITNSITIGSLPAISGTVTANVFGKDYDGTAVALPILTHESGVATRGIPIGFNDNGNGTFFIVGDSQPLPVAGASYDGGSLAIPLGNDGDAESPSIVVPIGFAGDGEFKRVAFDAGLPISGTITVGNTVVIRSNGINNDPWVYIPRLTMSHPDTGNFVFDGYYRFNGENQWGSPNFNSGNCAYLTRFVQGDNYFFNLMVHDENNDQEITFAQWDAGQTTDFPTSMIAIDGTLVSGSLTFNTEQRESYGVRVTNSITVGNTVTIAGTVTANPTGTQTIAGSVTLGAGTAQIGSVTAGLAGWELLGQRNFFSDQSLFTFQGSQIGLYSSIGITYGDGGASTIEAFYTPVNGQDHDVYWTSQNGENIFTIVDGGGFLTAAALSAALSFDLMIAPSTSKVLSVYGKKENTLALTNAQLRGSAVTISGTVTAVNHQGTTVTTSNFTSTTPSTILASANTGREVLTIFNEGAGNLHISAGATCTTIAYQVRLLAGDYYEVPINQTSLAHSAVFATAGTARVTQVS